MPDDLIGKSLGQFEIIEEVGRGGMATVYRARQTSINRIVAIKVLPRTLLHDPSFYERFAREVDVVAHLEHPHILPIYDYGEAEGMPYIAMRYLSGGSMAQWIWRGLPPLDKIPKPFEQIASALDYAHQEGIIHRDLKPGNVLLDEMGNAYLSDFGIARVLNSNLTGSAIIGTPAYMSPEQANGLPLDARSDIYSLGVVLYELVTGREPFEAETPVALLLKHINEPMPSARLLRPELPAAAEKVINKATAKNPDERYPSASDVAEAFVAAVHGGTAAAPELDDESQPTLFDPESLLRRTPTAAITGQNQSTPMPINRPVTEPITPPPTGVRSPTEVSPATGLPVTSVTPRSSSRGLIIGLALVLGIVLIVAVAFVFSRANQPPAPQVAAMPTPFANAVTVQRDQYTISVPDGWVFDDLSDQLGLYHSWSLDNLAYVRISLIAKTVLTPSGDFAAAMDAYDAENIQGDNTIHLIDAATAPDGSVRRSYQRDSISANDFLPGQVDYFYLNRGKYLVVLETFSAYKTGNEYVPVFQSVLDLLRIASPQA